LNNLHKIQPNYLIDKLIIYILYHQNVVHNRVRIFRDGRAPLYFGADGWTKPINYKSSLYKELLDRRVKGPPYPPIDWSRVEII